MAKFIFYFQRFIFDLQRFVTNYKPNVLVNGTDSDDKISNYPDYGSEGNNSIKNWRSSYLLIDGGAGRDTIIGDVGGSPNYCTISGGTGDDRISIRSGGSNNVYLYNKGDGNDTIDGFKADSTLSISGSSYSTAESGRDVIVYVGDGSILLTWAATLPAINIVEAVVWKLSGTTATYGTSSNAQITINKSLDGIFLKGSTVTIANSALNQSNVTISNGYTLVLGNDVTQTSTTAADWDLNGTQPTQTLTRRRVTNSPITK